MGALTLYLDFINMFIFLLQLSSATAAKRGVELTDEGPAERSAGPFFVSVIPAKAWIDLPSPGVAAEGARQRLQLALERRIGSFLLRHQRVVDRRRLLCASRASARSVKAVKAGRGSTVPNAMPHERCAAT